MSAQLARTLGLAISKRPRPPSLLRVCIHEAGHAVVQLAIGAPADVFAIRVRQEEESREWEGIVRQFGSAPKLAEVEIKIRLAGPIAEARRFRACTGGYHDDMRHVSERARKDGLAGADVRRLFAETEALVEREWDNVERVAGLVRALRGVTSDQLRTFVRTRSAA